MLPQTMVNSSGTTTYGWDFENRLTSVSLPGSGGTVSFKYDPFGRRIYKSSTSGTSVYAFDGDNLIEETNSAGGVVARYEQGLNIDEPLVMLRSATTSYYQADGLGSITSLTNTSGAAAETYSYDSFGNILATTGSLTNSFKYTGREFDTETSLYYYRARYYDQAIGRFINEDPLRFGGSQDFYAYVDNRPTISVVPLGLSTLVFDRGTGTLTLYPGFPYPAPIAVFPAGNFTMNPNGDPNTINDHGPAPNGTYPVQAPIDTGNSPAYGPYFFPIESTWFFDPEARNRIARRASWPAVADARMYSCG